jgi:hypothetical protein
MRLWNGETEAVRKRAGPQASCGSTASGDTKCCSSCGVYLPAAPTSTVTELAVFMGERWARKPREGTYFQ